MNRSEFGCAYCHTERCNDIYYTDLSHAPLPDLINRLEVTALFRDAWVNPDHHPTPASSTAPALVLWDLRIAAFRYHGAEASYHLYLKGQS